MQARLYVEGAQALSPLAASVVTVGTFDGVHIGHQALVGRAVARAKALGVPAAVYTFHPHPAKILAPARAPAVLQSIEERARLLRSYGADLVVVEPFDASFAAIGADEWVEQYLVARFNPRAVVIGFNFSYGRARSGGPEHMTTMGARHGFAVDVVGAVRQGAEVVSSTVLRGQLERGEVEAAAGLLGRPFALTGLVIKGEERGRTIGVPTANIASEAEIVPRFGVYVSRTELEDGRRFGSVTNIGRSPTFGATAAPRVETHLFDFSGDLYGQRLRVELIARLRDEQRFGSVPELVAQIRDDIGRAKERLAR
jgi:riboflavin kinase/FMN adenylyltransferase